MPTILLCSDMYITSALSYFELKYDNEYDQN